MALQDLKFSISTLTFDENYIPSSNTRTTTNFANLARGERREENLRNTIAMINKTFNGLATWDNADGDRYKLELEINSVNLDIDGSGNTFPSIEILKTYVIDTHTNKRIEGIVGNNFSSYVRDYDFSVRLLDHNKGKEGFSIPDNYGVLHGNIFKAFINSETYKKNYKKTPVICLSVSDSKVYTRTSNVHPILGVEYTPNETSLTESYFQKMGLQVRYFMPPQSKAPFAFYFFGDLLQDYSNLELISTISVMSTFQRIYRPEIYNANDTAGRVFRPKLNNPDHSLTRIEYDRAERTQLAINQGKFTEEEFINVHKELLEQLTQETIEVNL